MISPGFLIALGAVVIGALVAAFFLIRRARMDPEPASPGPDREAWSRLVRMGTLALTTYGRAPATPASLRPLPPEAAPAAPAHLSHHPLREVDLDPRTLVGQGASRALAELGAPDKVAPGEAWYSHEEAAHYIMDPRGNLARVPVFGAVPMKIEVGEPYLRWSWEHLVRPAAPGDVVTWTLCLTAPEGGQEPVVVEVLTHPTSAVF